MHMCLLFPLPPSSLSLSLPPSLPPSLPLPSLFPLSISPVPGFTEYPGNTTAPLNTSVTFTCAIEQQPFVVWVRNGLQLTSPDILAHLATRGIFVSNVTMDDSVYSLSITILASKENNGSMLHCIAGNTKFTQNTEGDAFTFSVFGKCFCDVCYPYMFVRLYFFVLKPFFRWLPPHNSLLTPHSSPLTPHPSLLTPHSSPLTPHSSPLTPHSSPLTPHLSLLTSHSSLLTSHSSLLTPHSSPLTPHSSPLTHHSSPLTPHPVTMHMWHTPSISLIVSVLSALHVANFMCSRFPE